MFCQHCDRIGRREQCQLLLYILRLDTGHISKAVSKDKRTVAMAIMILPGIPLLSLRYPCPLTLIPFCFSWTWATTLLYISSTCSKPYSLFLCKCNIHMDLTYWWNAPSNIDCQQTTSKSQLLGTFPSTLQMQWFTRKGTMQGAIILYIWKGFATKVCHWTLL